MEFCVRFKTNPQNPLYKQLYTYIVNEIINSRLTENHKLPSIRELSRQLNISKNTVETAYQQLSAEGYIYSRAKSGFYVNAIGHIPGYNPQALSTDEDARENCAAAVIEYDFSSDYIDQESFNFPIWKKHINKALKDNQQYLTYGSHQGEYVLRKEIARYLRQSRGVVCTPEQVIVGAGVQSLLHILCALLKPSCNSIAFEDPGFQKGRQIFHDHNFNVIPIPLENGAISISLLSQSKAQIVYVSPSHQFPMGSTMPINKRLQLLKWAHENNSIIIEDDFDSELRYYAKPIPSLQGLNNGNGVVYLSSFSKILLPSLRISYLVLPPNLLAAYEEIRNKYNQTSSTIEQIALAQFMKDGCLERHIRRLRKIYAKKNQLITEAIHNTMKDKVIVRGKETGLYLLLEIKTSRTTEQIVATAEKTGVKLTPASNYYIDKSPPEYPQILLFYGGIPKEHIIPAIRTLKKAWFGNQRTTAVPRL